MSKNRQLESPWFHPHSSQLCVSLQYYTHSNAASGSTPAQLHVEYGRRKIPIIMKSLEASKVSVTLNSFFDIIQYSRAHNYINTTGLLTLYGRME